MSRRRSAAAMLALAALALALRCYGLTAPLLDYHSWRQADTAAIARNYATNGYRLPYPQVDWGGPTPGYVESEFPLYTYTLALLYGIFGIHDWLGRLLTALCGALASAALFGLVRGDHRPGSGRVALYAGAALALMPFPLYFGRTVMPDTLMLLTAILAIWTFRRWTERQSTGRLIVALVCGTLAPLAKTPNLVIVAVPLAYLLWRERAAWRAWGLLLLYGTCFTLPSLLWIWHARTLPSVPQLSFGIGEKLFDLRLLADPQFYRLLGRWSIENVLTLAGVPFFILGLAPTVRMEDRGSRIEDVQDQSSILYLLSSASQPSGGRWLPHAWLLGVLVFLGAGAAGVAGQDYYILSLAGPAAWLVGIGIDRAQRLVEPRTGQGSSITGEGRASASHAIRAAAPGAGITRLVPALGLAAIAALSLWRIAPLYETAEFYRTLGRRLDLALPAEARAGIVAPAVSEILYYAQRKGWRLDPIVVSVPGGLASLPPDHGVRYVLIADPWLTEQRELLTAALREYRRIPIGPYALLLDLNNPGQQQPAELIWETGHLVAEPFLGAWHAAGGAGRLGYPLSDEIAGPEGQEQYFERGLLVLDGLTVERAPIGRLLLAAYGHTPQPSAIDPTFQAAWERAGGEAALGQALSPAIESDGRRTQYFEFGTLEALSGMNPGPGASGRRLLEARGLTEERQIELMRDLDH